MHDGNLHPITGIPEETIKMLYEAWKSGKATGFEGFPIAWDEIYSLTSSLQDKYGNTYMTT